MKIKNKTNAFFPKSLILIMVLAIASCGKDDEQVIVKVPAINSDFDSGNDEWKIEGDANGGQVTDINPEFSSADGVDNSGHIFAVDDVAGGVWYFVAPSKYRGNKSEYFGGVLQYYLRQSSIDSQFDADDIIIETANNEAIIYHYPTGTFPNVEWIKYDVRLDESAEWVDLTGQPVSNDQIKAALSNIVKLRIRGEFRSGQDTGRLDSFSFLK